MSHFEIQIKYILENFALKNSLTLGKKNRKQALQMLFFLEVALSQA